MLVSGGERIATIVCLQKKALACSPLFWRTYLCSTQMSPTWPGTPALAQYKSKAIQTYSKEFYFLGVRPWVRQAQSIKAISWEHISKLCWCKALVLAGASKLQFLAAAGTSVPRWYAHCLLLQAKISTSIRKLCWWKAPVVIWIMWRGRYSGWCASRAS